MSNIASGGDLSSVPLNNEPNEGSKGPSRRGSAQNASGDTGGGGGQSGPSEFIKKLYGMLEDENAQYSKGRSAGRNQRGSVGWGKGGLSFVVWDMNDFTVQIL